VKKAFVFIVVVMALTLFGIWLIFHNDTGPELDTAAINDAVITALQNDSPGEVMNTLIGQLQQEIERIDTARRNRDTLLLVYIISLFLIMTIITAGMYLYLRRSILLPFQKMQKFARDVAMGNLDIPLEMDMHGRFGAFTESFDLMREELKKARENERNADRSKKELVASLSHDIKTPVASIKATTELLLLSAENEKERKQLEQIEAKAEQINTLITDMFHATLEELQALNVTVSEVHSTVITDLIQSADYKNLVKPFTVPECIILADIVRLQQIFDNIIGNSYKYADTPIKTTATYDGQYLVVSLKDSGPGVPEEELPLITGKYYRGNNASDKSGYGLGLYISKYLLTQMSGDLRCENYAGGFNVGVILNLPGSFGNKN